MSATATQLVSTIIAELDTVAPNYASTAGEGAGAPLLEVEDSVAITTSNFAEYTNFRLCRIPANAKIKKVEICASELDSGATPTFDIGVAFSDSTVDGTPAELQGMIPLTGEVNSLYWFEGGVVSSTSVSAPSTSSTVNNALFGSVTSGTEAYGIPMTEVSMPTGTHNETQGTMAVGPGPLPSGSPTAVSWLTFVQTPIIDYIGMQYGSGQPMTGPGYIDIYVTVASAPTTPVAGTFFGRVTYTV